MQRLSVPLQKGKNQQMPVRDVRIAQENTKRQRERERAQALERKVAEDAAGKSGEAP